MVCLYYEYIYSTPEKLINKTFRSDDNGITWSQIFKDHENASNIYIYEKIQILVDPNDAQKVYRCLDGSVAVSEDKGNNWAELNPGINGYTLVIDPTNSNNLYYFNPSDIAKSTNSGQSWQITPKLFWLFISTRNRSC